MKITRLKADNWRNFKSVDIPVGDRLFIVGPNAAGKSNLLDTLRFLGDIATPGGGLAAAVDRRGGFGKVRSLFARNSKNGRLVLEVQLADGDDRWLYRLAIRGEGKGHNRPFVAEEVVELNGVRLLSRPDESDEDDAELSTQTHLQQISANKRFRILADYFTKIRYFHLVPQIIRSAGGIDERKNDPYGGDFIAQINATPTQSRAAWLRRMEQALQAAVPEFESLRIETDPAGRPHLRAGYRNWRSSPTTQGETEFSDGTLRLIGLLWAIVSTPANGGVLLLEEPELSLNSAIVRTLPTVLAKAQRDRDLQVFLSTHAPGLLDDEGIAPQDVLVLRVTGDGTTADILADIPEVEGVLAAELPLSEIIEGLIAPQDLSGLVAAGSPRR